MTSLDELSLLLEAARRLPPMTAEERALQALNFAYGNLACTTNHKPARGAFRRMTADLGWPEERFAQWADDKEWAT